MTARKPCPEAPGPLEPYARQFDACFGSLAQRRAFRAYLQGLLLPRDRNKTLTALAGTEPGAGAQHPAAQQLQYFLSEADWDALAVNARRLELLLADSATVPHAGGVLVIDDTGDRKAGAHTAHVGRQYLGSVGKLDNGIVAVTSLWADARVYYPLHVEPYTPARRLPRGQADPAFRTKPQLAVQLVAAAVAAGVPFRAVVADSFYGDSLAFEEGLWEAGLPFVLALKPKKGHWAPLDDAHTPVEAAQDVPWHGPRRPGGWTRVVRRFRDGHTATWWAADARLAGYGPDRSTRLVVATTDPATLPPRSTWYLVTNLPRPGSPRAARSPFAAADLAEVVRLYGLRTWVEQGYKQVKGELGWADFQVRADRAIRRHWHLVGCAFAFCWRAWFAAGRTAWPPPPPEPRLPPDPATPPPAPAGRGGKAAAAAGPAPARHAAPPGRPLGLARVAGGAALRPQLAGALDQPLAHLARLALSNPAPGAPVAPRPRRGRLLPAPLSPALTKYRY
jgi:SRSO17 transposase